MWNTAKHELREVDWLALSNNLLIATARCPLAPFRSASPLDVASWRTNFWADGVPYPRPKIPIDASSISAALHRTIIEWAARTCDHGGS
jgi:hypothetical protein